MPAFIGLGLTCYDWIPVIFGDEWIRLLYHTNHICYERHNVLKNVCGHNDEKAIGQSKGLCIFQHFLHFIDYDCK